MIKGIDDKTFRDLLGPTQFSSDGFLGKDTRDPEEIIKEDAETLRQLGTTKEKMAAALREVYIAAERAMGNPVQLSERITATHHEARGRIPSPFPNDGTFQKGEALVKDSSTGGSFCISPLAIHLIEKYGFFQGKESRYRIEPKTAVEMLKGKF
jgi:hypothetical protein